MKKYEDARAAAMLGATTPSEGKDFVKVSSGELICCPRCDGVELTMQTWELRNGLVMGYSGMVADYYCRNCDKMLTLGFFNQPLGDDKLAARINWVVEE